jgi:hypothetical protein
MVGGSNVATMQAGDPAGDRQAQADALKRALGVGHPKEPIEDSVEVPFRYARAMVA